MTNANRLNEFGGNFSLFRTLPRSNRHDRFICSVLETHVGVKAEKPYNCLAMIRANTQHHHVNKQDVPVVEGPALRYQQVSSQGIRTSGEQVEPAGGHFPAAVAHAGVQATVQDAGASVPKDIPKLLSKIAQKDFDEDRYDLGIKALEEEHGKENAKKEALKTAFICKHCPEEASQYETVISCYLTRDSCQLAAVYLQVNNSYRGLFRGPAVYDLAKQGLDKDLQKLISTEQSFKEAVNYVSPSGHTALTNTVLNAPKNADDGCVAYKRSPVGSKCQKGAECKHGHFECIKVLIRANADCNVSTKHGSPLDVAEKTFNRHAEELLEIFGASARNNRYIICTKLRGIVRSTLCFATVAANERSRTWVEDVFSVLFSFWQHVSLLLLCNSCCLVIMLGA